MTTITIDHETKLEKWFALACSGILTKSSEGESASDRLDRRLRIVAIGAVIFYALCIWEFTIGIKKSINKLFIG